MQVESILIVHIIYIVNKNDQKLLFLIIGIIYEYRWKVHIFTKILS